MKLDGEDRIIMISLSLLILSTNFGGVLNSGSGPPTNTGPLPTNPEIQIDKPIPSIVPTVVVPKPTVVVPKPTPDILFDMDIDTKALLYKKGDCTILIKDYTDIGNKDAEVGNCTYSDWEDFKKKIPTPKPTLTPTTEPTATVVPTAVPPASEKLLSISELDNYFDRLSRDGWNGLYELNEFDCSRMSSYWQIILEKDYGIKTEILISDTRRHAWIEARVSDFRGDYEKTYVKWTDSNGEEWYYIEPTFPKVIRYTDVPFYNVKDTKLIGTYEEAIQYNREDFKLTTEDNQKVANFMNN